MSVRPCLALLFTVALSHPLVCTARRLLSSQHFAALCPRCGTFTGRSRFTIVVPPPSALYLKGIGDRVPPLDVAISNARYSPRSQLLYKLLRVCGSPQGHMCVPFEELIPATAELLGLEGTLPPGVQSL